MSKNNERGFSLIELLLVVVVIGVVATVAFPALQKSIWAAESGSTIANLRTISTTQTTFFSQRGRFGRLSEVNNVVGGSLGTPVGTDLMRDKFTYIMIPRTPTDRQLRDGYTILAWRWIPSANLLYVYELRESGQIRQILP